MFVFISAVIFLGRITGRRPRRRQLLYFISHACDGFAACLSLMADKKHAMKLHDIARHFDGERVSHTAYAPRHVSIGR